MRYDDLSVHGNGKYMPRCHINISTSVNQLVNFTIETNVTAYNLIGNIELWIKKSPKSSSYEILCLKTSLNLCRFFEGVAGNFLIRSLLESMTETGNKIFTCPFEPQIYKLNNLPVSDDNYPKFFLTSSVHFKINVSVKAKFGKNRKFEHAFSYLGYGTIKKN